MSQTIVLATGNQHKVSELEYLLKQGGLTDISLVAVTSLVPDFAPEESGGTFEANAWIKANQAYLATGLPSLADDSGLEIALLNNEPGVLSARYSGDGATDLTNRKRVREELAALDADTSDARFRCVLCLVMANEIVFGEGSCEGTVSVIESGVNGFGYDSMFTPKNSQQTFGEMSEAEKSIHSHRAKAVQHLLASLLHTRNSTIATDLTTDLVTASVLSAKGAWDSLHGYVERTLVSANDIQAYYEALLQLYLFAGFPTALEALLVLNSVVKKRFPDFQMSAEQFDADLFTVRGTKLFSKIYAGVESKMLASLAAATPDLAEWMLLEGYGKTLSRDGLDIVTRELCIVGVLAMSGHSRQLTSHVRGARLVGATSAQLLMVADVVQEYGEVDNYQVLTSLITRYSSDITYP